MLIDGSGNPIICDECADCQQIGDCAYVIAICNSNGEEGVHASDDIFNIVLNGTQVYSNLDLVTAGTCPGILLRTNPDIPASVTGMSACCIAGMSTATIDRALIPEGDNVLRMNFVSSNDEDCYGIVGVYQVVYDGADWVLAGTCFEDEYFGDSGTSYEFNFTTCSEPCPPEDPPPCGSGPTASFDSLLIDGCTYQFTNTSTPGDCGPIVECRWTFHITLYDGSVVQITRPGCSITVSFSQLLTEFAEAGQLTEICPDYECEGVPAGPLPNPLMGCSADSVLVVLTVKDEEGYEDSASDTVNCDCGIPEPGEFAIYSWSVPRGDGTYDVYARVLVEGPRSDDCGRPLCVSVLLSLNIDFGTSECGPCVDPNTCNANEYTLNYCACENIDDETECDGGRDGTETYPPVTGLQYGFGQTIPYPDNPYTEEELGALPQLDGCAYTTMYLPATNCCGSTVCDEVIGSPSHVACC